MTQDEEHLRLLSIFHYVVGGLVGLGGLFALFPLISLIGVTTEVLSISASAPLGERFPLPFANWFSIFFALASMVAGGICSAFIIAAGRFLAQRRHYLFCLVVAGIECIFQPFGTVLGVLTLIVLTRDTVKGAFSAGGSANPSELAHA